LASTLLSDTTHSTTVLTIGTAEAGRAEFGPLDSLHLATARLLKADQFITTELVTDRGNHRHANPVGVGCGSQLLMVTLTHLMSGSLVRFTSDSFAQRASTG